MKRRASDTGVYKYLQAAGVLEKGPDAIANAKRDYWRVIKIQWKKDKYKVETPFTVLFTPSELRVLTEAAALHNFSRTRFIKLACLAYAGKKYLVPNIEILYQIKSCLSLNYSVLQEMVERDKVPYLLGVTLMQKIQDLEQEVLSYLFHPKHLDNDS